jgi:2-oxoglutarate dehydrogenase E2 component (dihydrolipoamide succinyltransferase)
MSNTVEILAPAEQTEGTRSQILRWLKNVGDAVAQNEPLIEIETDKVTVEVAAPASGVLREILKSESEEIAPGDVLGRLQTGADDAASKASERGKFNASNGAGSRAEADANTSAAASGATRAGTRLTAGGLSPAVRRLLTERNLDASAIRGSGEGGRITVDDVLSFASGKASAETESLSRTSKETALEAAPQRQPKPAADTPASQPSSATVQPSATGTAPTQLIPHSAIRKRIADHMVQSLLHTAPHVTTVFEADMTSVMAHRSAHKADFDKRGAPLTFTAYFLTASVKAIRAVPEANSRWTDTALELFDTINIGIATAIEDIGLVVPVLKDVGSKSLFEIAKGLNELVTAARAGKLQPTDVRGGTFTISNHGVSGSLLAAPIVINQPQSAILGVGKLEKRVTVDENDKVIIRPKCYITLTLDHRVMDGHRANLFMQTFVRALETWPAQ